MSDVYCHNCGEPWDSYGLRHEIIWETDLPERNKDRFNGQLPITANARTRQAFRDLGWEFGRSVLNVKSCPCCKANLAEQADDQPEEIGILRAKIMEDRRLFADVIEDVLGDDLDAVQTEMEDLG
jgi:hypothetical protein